MKIYIEDKTATAGAATTTKTIKNFFFGRLLSFNFVNLIKITGVFDLDIVWISKKVNNCFG